MGSELEERIHKTHEVMSPSPAPKIYIICVHPRNPKKRSEGVEDET